MKKKTFICIIIINLSFSLLAKTNFDELDRLPQGAHKGQIMVTGFVIKGWPLGKIVGAEQNYLDGFSYTFSNGTTKLIMVDHMSLAAGVQGEYMPIDHLGVKGGLERYVVSQRSIFGSDYKNWQGSLYRDFTLFVGPTLHATTRKQWDFVLAPFFGFSYATYDPIPVLYQIYEEYHTIEEQSQIYFSFGTELSFQAYFSGGPMISLGCVYNWRIVKLDKAINLTNPYKFTTYFDGETKGIIHSIDIIFSAGYAFDN